jgi:probable selenium-dependent hydroxylase accessory protein YqeC
MNELSEKDEIFMAISGYMSSRSLISITGGGGKTSLMFYLARIMSRADKIICSATTKLCLPYPCEVPVVLTAGCEFSGIKASISETFGKTSPLLIGETEKDGKLIGISSDLADRLFVDGISRHVIVEADGARSLPFKAYENHEPVMPAFTTLHIVVVGSEILVSPLSHENVFRFELLQNRWGIRDGEILSRGGLAEILNSRSEYLKDSPQGAKRMLFFNKYDIASDRENGICADESRFDGDISFSRLFAAYDAVIFASLKNGEISALRAH